MREAGPITLPLPDSLLPLQDETPGWSKLAPLAKVTTGKRKCSNRKHQASCLSSPQPARIHWPAPSPHPKLSIPTSSEKLSRQTSSFLDLLKPIPGSLGLPATLFSSQAILPYVCSECLLTSRSPVSSLRYPGNPGPHPAQMPSPGQLPRATPRPPECSHMHARQCT